MSELDAAQRKALKARAHQLDPVVIIGAKGLTPGVVAEIGRALDAHELVKIRAGEAGRDDRELLLAEICTRCAAEAVQHIGAVLVIYRALPKRPEAVPVSRPRSAPVRPRHAPRTESRQKRRPAQRRRASPAKARSGRPRPPAKARSGHPRSPAPARSGRPRSPAKARSDRPRTPAKARARAPRRGN